MTKLKLGAIPDDKPVKVTVTFSAAQHALLADYAAVHSAQFDRKVPPEKLIPHILERFIRTDRAFARARRGGAASGRNLKTTGEGRGQ